MTLSSVLVVPRGACNPRTGGGQRTRILFEALKAEGSVVVVQLDESAGQGSDEFFPGAVAVHRLAAPDLSPPKARLPRLLRGIRRAGLPWRDFVPHPGLGTDIARLATEHGARLIAFRYLRSATLAAGAGAGRAVAIDIDDRDDARLLAYVAAAVGPRLARTLYAPWLVRSLRPRLSALLSRADHVWVAKDGDLKDLELGATPVSVWPNVPFVSPAPDMPSPGAARDTLFVGSIGHSPNRKAVDWLIGQVWPDVAAAVPEGRLRLVGLGDWRGVVPDDIAARDRIDVVGPVEDLEAEYARARLVLCPVFVGAGSQIKVIEAAAHGRPVVASSLAAAGFGPEVAAAIRRADTPAAFVAACLAYLSDADRATADGATLARVAAGFSRDGVAARLQNDIRRAIG